MNQNRPLHFHPAQIIARRPHLAALLDPDPPAPGSKPRAVRCLPCAVAALRSRNAAARRDKAPNLEAKNPWN